MKKLERGKNKFLSNLIKVEEKREPGTIARRTDFNYLDGHGTFYKFDKKYFPSDLLDTEEGDRVSLVLRNLHTNNLDEVVFDTISKFKVGEKSIWFRGHIVDSEDYYGIKIEYYINRPLESYILVHASGHPFYDIFSRP